MTDLAGYRLYYGNASRTYSTTIEAGLATTVTVANLPEGNTYFFAVTAYNRAGLESDFSEELAWTSPSSSILSHFTWGPIASPQAAGVPFAVSITAKNAQDVPLANFTGTVSLGALASTTVTSGAGTGSSSFPMAASSEDARTQVIYLTNEVGQAGWLDALALNVKTPPGQTLENWTLRLKHTTLGSYTSKSVWETNGWSVVCRGDQTVTSTGWVYFTFSTPFYYNGTNNLMVDFSFNNTSSSSAGSCGSTSASKKQTLCCKADSTYGDPLTWSKTTPRPTVTAVMPSIQLRFGGPVTINPTSTGGFVNGQWTGTVTVLGPAAGVRLSADDGSGHTGISRSFDVIASSDTSPQSALRTPGEPPESPDGDSDGDGILDSQELHAGTDPLDPDSVLGMTALASRPIRKKRVMSFSGPA